MRTASSAPANQPTGLSRSLRVARAILGLAVCQIVEIGSCPAMRARVFGNGLDSCHSVFDKRCGLFNCTRMKPVGSVIESPQVAEQVADMVGLSRSRLFQLFSEQLASSQLVYRSGIRLEEAVTRLRGRAPQLTELALDLGFSAPGNFSRFFRSHRGVTPSAYRRVLQAA